MNTRIENIRKHLGLSRAAFGKRIGVSGDVINNLERGRVEIKEHIIKLICNEFNVNEEWLRNGTGEMFIEVRDEAQLMEWAGRVLGGSSDSYQKRFIKTLMSLSEDEWEALASFATKLVKAKENDAEEDQ